MKNLSDLEYYILLKPFTYDDFNNRHKLHAFNNNTKNGVLFHDGRGEDDPNSFYEYPSDLLRRIIIHLNKNRDLYLETKNPEYLEQILCLIPRTWYALYA